MPVKTNATVIKNAFQPEIKMVRLLFKNIGMIALSASFLYAAGQYFSAQERTYRSLDTRLSLISDAIIANSMYESNIIRTMPDIVTREIKPDSQKVTQKQDTRTKARETVAELKGYQK